MRPPKLLTPLLFAAGLVACSSSAALAQVGEYHNGIEFISSNSSVASSSTNVTFGPNADITVNGNWYITATTFTIDPAAKVTGTGTIHLMSQKTYNASAPSLATTFNAGGNTGTTTGIGCKISLENQDGITLAGANDLVMNNTLSLARVGAHLTLNARSLKFTATATAVPDFTAPPATPVFAFNTQSAGSTGFSDAYIVTNGAGMVSKAGVTNGSVFTFPIGISAPANYTPATVTNTAAMRELSARVQDYANSAPVENNVATGVDRTWMIQGSIAGTATIALLHNAGTQGSKFNNNSAFVTQFTTAGGWSVGTPMAATTPNFTHTGTFSVPVGTDGSYFSKSSDATNSLNAFIAVSAKVFLQGAYSGSSMTNALRTANLIPAAQPYNFAPFSYAGTESSAAIPATTTDWVLVELRNSATPATVVATRAGFLLNNGSVTDLDGTSPLSFRNTTPGNYFVVVRHRNHLAVRSALALTFTQDAATAYDFTTAQNKAYQNPAITTNGAQVETAVGSGVFAMYGGNANSNTAVNYLAIGTDRFFMLTSARNASSVISGLGNDAATSLSNVYSNSDLTLNGVVNYVAIGSDRFFLLVNVLGNDRAKIINQHL